MEMLRKLPHRLAWEVIVLREMRIFPVELTSDVPVITLSGNELVHIEQHKGLECYRDDEIILRTSAGRLHVTGREMYFKTYTAYEAVIAGCIDNITIQGGK